MVINKFRPLTPDAESTLEVMSEIETACGIKITGLVNNSNLGVETTAEDVLGSLEYAKSVSEASRLEIVCTCVNETLYNELRDKIDNLFPLKLQGKIN